MFEIDVRSRKSICEQIVYNIRELVLVGSLVSNQKLPSVRELSKSLTVNPNTVQKAFSELERLGYVYTIAGVGTFVSNRDAVKSDNAFIDSITKQIAGEVRELFYLGLDKNKVKKLVKKVIDEQELQIENRRQK